MSQYCSSYFFYVCKYIWEEGLFEWKEVDEQQPNSYWYTYFLESTTPKRHNVFEWLHHKLWAASLFDIALAVFLIATATFLVFRGRDWYNRFLVVYQQFSCTNHLKVLKPSYFWKLIATLSSSFSRSTIRKGPSLKQLRKAFQINSPIIKKKVNMSSVPPTQPAAKSAAAVAARRAELLGGNPTGIRDLHDALASIKRMHTESFREVNAALDADEKGDLQKAKGLYHKGMNHMIFALAITIPPNATGQDVEEARGRQEKMTTNLDMVKERVAAIDSELGISDSDSSTSLSSIKPKPTKPASSVSSTTKKTSTSTAKKTSSLYRYKNVPEPGGRISSRSKLASGPSSSASSKTPPGRARVPTSRSSHGPAAAAASIKGKTTDARKKALKGVDSKLADRILDEIVQETGDLSMDDIIGLKSAKAALDEIVVLPSLRPELFTGLRAPARGLLLFGPPGNGKTMIAKAVASKSKTTFFNISASSLTSKWVGESEKLVRALFAVARELQPSIVFIDEVDSILSSRSAGENDSARRLKTEILVQFDGVGSGGSERVLVMGATNLPQELDEAGLRRFPKRIYIQMPDKDARAAIIEHLLKKADSRMSSSDIGSIARQTEGYSGSDLTHLTRDAVMCPIRELGSRIQEIEEDQIRPVMLKDFTSALKTIKPSTSLSTIATYEKWAREHGSS